MQDCVGMLVMGICVLMYENMQDSHRYRKCVFISLCLGEGKSDVERSRQME